MIGIPARERLQVLPQLGDVGGPPRRHQIHEPPVRPRVGQETLEHLGKLSLPHEKSARSDDRSIRGEAETRPQHGAVFEARGGPGRMRHGAYGTRRRPDQLRRERAEALDGVRKALDAAAGVREEHDRTGTALHGFARLAVVGKEAPLVMEDRHVGPRAVRNGPHGLDLHPAAPQRGVQVPGEGSDAAALPVGRRNLKHPHTDFSLGDSPGHRSTNAPSRASAG